MKTMQSVSSAFITSYANELDRIHEQEVNLCVWERTVAPQLEQYVDRVLLPLSIHREETLGTDNLGLDRLLRDFPADDGLDLFRADVEELVRRYVDVTNCRRIIVKIESFGGTLCERFHVDAVQLRMICSYAGPGTQWLANEDVDRRKLGTGSGGLADDASGLIRAGAVVGELDRFAVGLMKGEKWPGNHGRGLVHRSPRIADKTVRRLLLKIEGAK